MPKPIVCLAVELRQYLETFRPCFSQRQWKYFVIVLLGLVECDDRKTLTGMRQAVADQISLSGLSRFLSKWPWQPEQVVATWLQRFRCRLEPLVQAEHLRLSEARPRRTGRPKATVVTGYLIMDDSVHIKPKGRKMGGLGRHYSNTEQRVVTGHCLFTGLYVLLGQRCPLQAALYRQRETAIQEDVPFQNKVDLAVQQIETFEPVADTHTHVLIDSWYHCKQVRKAAQKRGWDVSGGLKRNRVLRLVTEDGQREWLILADYAARLHPEDWQAVSWPAEEGGKTVYVHLVNSWVRKLGQWRYPGQMTYLSTRPRSHSISHPSSNIQIATIVGHQSDHTDRNFYNMSCQYRIQLPRRQTVLGHGLAGAFEQKPTVLN